MGWRDDFGYPRIQRPKTIGFVQKTIQKINNKPYVLPQYLILLLILIPLIIILFQRYILGWREIANWTGIKSIIINPSGENTFEYKTLWDWMELVLSPLIIALIAFWFNARDNYLKQERNIDEQRELALQSYLEKVTSEFLTSGDLIEPEKNLFIKTKTLSTLRVLDGIRKGYLIKFLYESSLIRDRDSNEILYNADLTEIVLNHAQLFEINLSNTLLVRSNFEDTFLRATNFSDSDCFRANFKISNLRAANFQNAVLEEADFQSSILDYSNLSNVSLKKGNFKNAQLFSTNLRSARLSGANFTNAVLNDSCFFGAEWDHICFKNATMPDGKKYDPQFHTKEYLTNKECE